MASHSCERANSIPTQSPGAAASASPGERRASHATATAKRPNPDREQRESRGRYATGGARPPWTSDWKTQPNPTPKKSRPARKPSRKASRSAGPRTRTRSRGARPTKPSGPNGAGRLAPANKAPESRAATGIGRPSASSVPTAESALQRLAAPRRGEFRHVVSIDTRVCLADMIARVNRAPAPRGSPPRRRAPAPAAGGARSDGESQPGPALRAGRGADRGGHRGRRGAGAARGARLGAAHALGSRAADGRRPPRRDPWSERWPWWTSCRARPR